MHSTLLILLLVFQSGQSSPSAWDQLKQKISAAGNPSQRSALPVSKVTAGLKEALTVATGNAIKSTGRTDGFLKNPDIHIPLPDKLRTASKAMRFAGMGSQVDALEVGMNRAAEQAAPAARQIFLDALTRMTFDDARRILSGNDTAATDFFRKQCSAELATAFTPIVHQSMENVGVVRQYNQIMKNPMAAQLAGNQQQNLENYVVGKALDGLFLVMGQEEKKIRKDPAAQTTALLREVFGARH